MVFFGLKKKKWLKNKKNPPEKKKFRLEKDKNSPEKIEKSLPEKKKRFD